MVFFLRREHRGLNGVFFHDDTARSTRDTLAPTRFLVLPALVSRTAKEPRQTRLFLLVPNTAATFRRHAVPAEPAVCDAVAVVVVVVVVHAGLLRGGLAEVLFVL